MLTKDYTNTQEYKQIINLLNKKYSYLESILKITKNTIFNNDIEDADIYIVLIEKRENIISELKLIDKKLELEDYYIKNIDDIEISAILKKISSISKEILKFDKEINKKMEKVYSDLKIRIKDISYGKTIQTAYQSDIFLDEGNYFN